jgi:TetR/AcrR family transcriptional repressor of lmrAB and yxaGH operons
MTTPRAHVPKRSRAAARRPATATVTAKAPSRERMIDATSALLQKQGYAGTGLAEILEASGAPRGSLYFHFPGGKEQLACEALAASGEIWKRRIDELTRGIDDPGEAAAAVCTMLGDLLEASDWELGCPIATVALEVAAGSEAIRTTCADHFASWEAIIAGRLVAAGFHAEIARTAATLAVAAVEGALLLARVYRSRVPLDRVSLALRAQLGAFRQ